MRPCSFVYVSGILTLCAWRSSEGNAKLGIEARKEDMELECFLNSTGIVLQIITTTI